MKLIWHFLSLIFYSFLRKLMELLEVQTSSSRKSKYFKVKFLVVHMFVFSPLFLFFKYFEYTLIMIKNFTSIWQPFYGRKSVSSKKKHLNIHTPLLLLGNQRAGFGPKSPILFRIIINSMIGKSRSEKFQLNCKKDGYLIQNI